MELTGGIEVDGAAFSVSDASFVLAGGEALAVTVTFAPTAVESSVGTITITSNDAANPEVTVDLSGAGFDPGEVQVLVDADGNTILGDFDGNAKVNLEDFFIFADNFGQTDFAEGTDLDGDGKVTLDDFFVFSDNFGLSGTYVGGS